MLNHSKEMNRKQNKSKGKAKAKDDVHNVMKDDEIEELIQKITLKRPRNKFHQFFLQENANREKKGQAKLTVTDYKGREDLMKKWEALPEAQKKVYEDLYEQEKVQFKKDMETVRHYLFKDYNDTFNNTPTAYRLFLNEKIREGYEKDATIQDIKKAAREEWNGMSLNEKQNYIDKMKEHKNWFENAKKLKRPTVLGLFVRKTFDEYRAANKVPPKIADVAKKWAKVKPDEKRRLQEMVDEIMEQRKEQRDIYELVNGIKPKRPAGAYRLFMLDLVEQKKYRNLQDTHEQWLKLPQEKKDEYLKKSHRIHVAYKFKKIMYDKRVRKMMPKRPPNAFGIYFHDKKGRAYSGDSALVYWRGQWEKLSDKEKEKYQKIRDEKMEKYRKKKILFESKVFDMPKKALTPFNYYVKDRIPDLVDEKPGKPVVELLKIAGEEWRQGENNNKKINKNLYEQLAKEDEKRFKREMEEFEKNGYFTDRKKLEEAKKKIQGDQGEEGGKRSRSGSKKRSSSGKKKKIGSKSPSKSAKTDARPKSGKKQK